MSALILAVDTALGACSAAVGTNGSLFAHQLEVMERGHAEALAPMVEAVMAQARLTFSALERLAVTTGPGTFTGQRVGLAFMRGLRLALDRPLIGVTSLAAMAHAACAETGLARAVALHDARRGEVYVQSVGMADDYAEPRLVAFGEAVAALSLVRAPFALAGTAAEQAFAALIPARGLTRLTAIRAPDARYVAQLAAGAVPSGTPVRPLYLRPADARLPGTMR
ncbi:MAG: tRNA (adenosine(37)-N6)-threonylcarbamoyltransferase complex dimerization subunit type 1 TsaB [Alphaproteobacteria bacterium]|nr:tRNA (adenosine(37)-N6)-threonylcarbamoyltransferase complex dimerization subunit type 1 TsaB [Alphaproteobacteria bacterium]